MNTNDVCCSVRKRASVLFSFGHEKFILPALLSFPTISPTLELSDSQLARYQSKIRTFRSKSGEIVQVKRVLCRQVNHCLHHRVMINGAIIKTKKPPYSVCLAHVSLKYNARISSCRRVDLLLSKVAGVSEHFARMAKAGTVTRVPLKSTCRL